MPFGFARVPEEVHRRHHQVLDVRGGNTDWKFTVKIRCNERQQGLHDLCNTREEYDYLSNGLSTTEQPLHH